MNILIVGAGGREHAMAWKINQSPKVKSTHVTPGNGGIESIADCWYLTDHQQIVAKAVDEKIDLVLIGQEDYSVNGLVELLEGNGIKVFGASAKAAQLEGSKVFAKEFMQKYNIPSARFKAFSDYSEAVDFLDSMNAPYVLKANGLAAGKGVLICEDLESARAGLKEILVDKAFGTAGDQVVIEEFMPGEEASWFVFTDGKHYRSLPSLQDHKRQLELDKGLNTGGMGCYAPAPIVNSIVEKRILTEVVEPTLAGMKKEGSPYKGVLYIGLMIENDQPRVVEYNIRFGDPECQPLMMLLDSDLVDIAEAIADERLDALTLNWQSKAAATVILASGGYPAAYEKGYTIQGLEEVSEDNECMIFHAGTKRDQNRYLTNGGRVLGVTCTGEDLAEAIKKAYQSVSKISWPGMQFRRDIGIKGLKRISIRKDELQVGIIMGSASDVKIAQKATKIFKKFDINYEVIVSSAHRTPIRTRNFVRESEERGVGTFIAIAGMAAHLPGVVASETIVPVIGVPGTASMGGNDALLSIVQMPPGIPVATVGLDRGDNAALLAIQILSLKYTELKARLLEYRLEMEQNVVASQKSVEAC